MNKQRPLSHGPSQSQESNLRPGINLSESNSRQCAHQAVAVPASCTRAIGSGGGGGPKTAARTFSRPPSQIRNDFSDFR